MPENWIFDIYGKTHENESWNLIRPLKDGFWYYNYCTLFLDDNFESCWLHMPADGVRALFPLAPPNSTTSIFNVSLFEFWFWTNLQQSAVKWMVFVAPADMRTRSKGRRSERANRARQMTLPKKPYRGAEANQQPSTKSASHCGFQGQKLDLCTRFADFFT